MNCLCKLWVILFLDICYNKSSISSHGNIMRYCQLVCINWKRCKFGVCNSVFANKLSFSDTFRYDQSRCFSYFNILIKFHTCMFEFREFKFCCEEKVDDSFTWKIWVRKVWTSVIVKLLRSNRVCSKGLY